MGPLVPTAAGCVRRGQPGSRTGHSSVQPRWLEHQRRALTKVFASAQRSSAARLHGRNVQEPVIPLGTVGSVAALFAGTCRRFIGPLFFGIAQPAMVMW